MYKKFIKKSFKSFPIAHFPSLMLLVGYPIFWWEMLSLTNNAGRTTPLAAIVLVLIFIGVISAQSKNLKRSVRFLLNDIKDQTLIQRGFLLIVSLVSLLILAISLYASTLPPHLMQEYDALNYHLTIPRQHLIQNSFAHIPWSSADLFPLPIQFALSPYWFLSELPNKFPQFIFLIGLIAVSARFVARFRQRWLLVAVLMSAVVLGTHGFGIQMGTAMLDLVSAYLLIAILDSLVAGYWILGAIELCFYFWSKSFMPLEIISLTILLSVTYLIFKAFTASKAQWSLGSSDPWLKIIKIKTYLWKTILIFIGLSFVIGGPFVYKSLKHAGTPLYPFFVGKFGTPESAQKSPQTWRSIKESATNHLSTKDQYGSPRNPVEFVKHFWILAVPEKGVNNRFDYPLGLMYLIFLGPFVFWWIQSIKERRFSILGWLVVFMWILWWEGSQQTRFLFAPLMLMYALTIVQMQKFTKIFWTALLCALMLNVLSVYGAHKHDLFVHDPLALLREKDVELLKMKFSNISEQKYIELDYHDVAFANFPVQVTKEKLPYVLWTGMSQK